MTKYRNPIPTVDVIIEVDDEGGAGPKIVLIRRKNPPPGWALPGGFVDYGESLETAARREATEETSLSVELKYQLGAYSEPSRDPRHHTITNVFVARATGRPEAGDDAAEVALYDPAGIPDDMAFDHGRIVADYLARRDVIGGATYE